MNPIPNPAIWGNCGTERVWSEEEKVFVLFFLSYPEAPYNPQQQGTEGAKLSDHSSCPGLHPVAHQQLEGSTELKAASISPKRILPKPKENYKRRLKGSCKPTHIPWSTELQDLGYLTPSGPGILQWWRSPLPALRMTLAFF